METDSFLNNLNINLKEILTQDNVMSTLKIVLIAVGGLLLLRLIIFFINKVVKKGFSAQSVMLVRKGIFYTGIFFIIIFVLNQFGVKLTTLLGAAGIIGIAVGFASQTSVSNIISGFFLIGEKTFQVGDIIQVDTTTGVILSVDLLSVKIRTFDNLYIRIPNESLIKTQMTNITRFPIRRLNLNISVAYKDDLALVKDVLLDIAATNPFCLDNPEPLFFIKEFASSGIDILFGVWFEKSEMLKLKNSIMMEIKDRFEQENIEIPFPHVSVYAGSKTGSFPVEYKDRVMEKKDA
jgi:small-conductance mechanosensitive channel